MLEITNESTIARIQSNLGKLVDKVENSISSNDNSNENICEKYKDKVRTPDEEYLFRKNGCLDSNEIEELNK